MNATNRNLVPIFLCEKQESYASPNCNTKNGIWERRFITPKTAKGDHGIIKELGSILTCHNHRIPDLKGLAYKKPLKQQKYPMFALVGSV